MEDISKNTRVENAGEDDAAEVSQADQWQSIKDVPFRGDLEVTTEKSAPRPEDDGPSETDVKPKTRLEEIEAEFVRMQEQGLGVADAENFLSTGEIQPGDSEEDCRRLESLFIEYVTTDIEDTLSSPRRDLKPLRYHANKLGGRLRDMKVGETTLGTVASYFAACENEGFKDFQSGREYTHKWDVNTSGFDHMHGLISVATFETGNECQIDDSDIHAYEEAMRTVDPDEPDEVRRAVMLATLHNIERNTEKEGVQLAEEQISCLDETLTDEEIVNSPVLLSRLKTSFEQGILQRRDNTIDHTVTCQEMYSEHIFSVAIPHLIETGQMEIDHDDLQAFGDLLAAQKLWRVNASSNPSKSCEHIMWLTKIGYDPLETGLRGVIKNLPLQDTLHAQNLISPENADRLYAENLRLMREQGERFTLDTDIEPSGENAAAVFWSKHAGVLAPIIEDYVGSTDLGANRITRSQEMIGEDGMPTEQVFKYILKKSYFETDAGEAGNNREANFILENRELFRDEDIFTHTLAQQMWAEDRPTGELDDKESAVLETYLACESGKFRYQLKNFLFDSHSQIVNKDGRVKRVYRFETFSPEQIAHIPKALAPLLETESSILSHATKATTIWAAENYSGEDIESAVKDVIHLFETGNHQEALANYPGLDRTLFMHYLHREDINPDAELTDTQKHILDRYISYRETDDGAKALSFRDFLCTKVIDDEETGAFHYRYENMNEEAIDKCADILNQLYDSNSTELSHLAPQIAERLLTENHGDAKEKIAELETLFLRKDLPDFAKLYHCANVLFSTDLSGETDISPVLKNAEDTRAVLMSDLLKISIASNNRSLRTYLESIMSGGTSDFNPEFASLSERLNLGDAGKILASMDAYHAEREAYHRDLVVEEPKGVFRLRQGIQPGDYIKGIKSDYLHTLIQNGFNCPEMTGDASKHDATHWDVDFGSAREEHCGSLSGAIEHSLANTYGDGLYIVVRDDARFQHTHPEDGSGYSDATRYETYHGIHNGENFRGVRTGLGSEDVDFYVTQIPAGRKVLRLKYELAKNGTYVPIVDRDSEKVVFTYDEYQALRASFGGTPRYGLVSVSESGERTSDLDHFHFAADLSLPDTLSFTPEASEGETAEPIEMEHKFSELVAGFDEKERETSEMQEKVTAKLLEAIASSDLPDSVKQLFANYRTHLSEDANVGSVDSLSTGSTGRFTNNPHDADFDFIWRIDRAAKKQYSDQIMQLLTTPGPDGTAAVERKNPTESPITPKGIRKGIVHVEIGGKDTPVEVDISPVIKTDKLTYSSDQALEHRFAAIRADDPEKYKQIIANIVMAKQMLKAGQAYKKGSYQDGQGGLGGIGVENWILQHGGSLVSAAEAFVAAARPEGEEERSFDDFRCYYGVFDLGENHFAGSFYPFDNFVAANMSPQGYKKMLRVCDQIIAARKK